MARNKQRISTPTIGRHAQDRIGRELRIIYADHLAEPPPAELLALLWAFEDAEAAQRRLQEAIHALRQANTGLGLDVTARTTLSSSLSVRAQQALLARRIGPRVPKRARPKHRNRPTRAAG
jgi:hypothetical protein